jgi:hypothetical protein
MQWRSVSIAWVFATTDDFDADSEHLADLFGVSR